MFGKTREELGEICAEVGLPEYAADQIAGWIYRRGARSFAEMTNLSRSARERLTERYGILAAPPTRVAESADGTRKYLFPTGTDRFVEAAYIPEKKRATLCLSVQVGCKMGCLFCMTARQGFQGNLDSGRIVTQYAALPERDRVSNIVFMGMGEPMDNLGAVLASLEILCSPWGYGLSPHRVTVSTIGVLPAMVEFLQRTEAHLAISVHSPFEEERRRLMPVENAHPLAEVLSEVKRQVLPKGRRVSFEYILFRDFNDSPRHARELVRLIHGLRCRVNLIPFHPIPGTPLKGAAPQRMLEFRDELNARGVTATIRRSRGLDIAAACGLLSTRALVRSEAAPDY